MLITPIKISPFARRSSGGGDVLAELFNTYLGHSQWAAQNSTVVGTTTTWLDYAGVHDVANPAAGNQPTTTNPDSDFNNKSSSTFITDDYLIKNTPNYGAGQTSGSLWFVIKTPSDYSALTSIPIFGVSNAGNNLQKLNIYIRLGLITIVVHDGTTSNIISIVNLLAADTEYIVEIENNGTSNSFYINGVLQSTNTIAGSNIGWFSYANTGNTLDNISIGGRINTSSQYYNSKIAYVGNYPLLDSTGRADMFNKLNTYYGVY